jgi:hypothetical protein
MLRRLQVELLQWSYQLLQFWRQQPLLLIISAMMMATITTEILLPLASLDTQQVLQCSCNISGTLQGCCFLMHSVMRICGFAARVHAHVVTSTGALQDRLL